MNNLYWNADRWLVEEGKQGIDTHHEALVEIRPQQILETVFLKPKPRNRPVSMRMEQRRREDGLLQSSFRKSEEGKGKFYINKFLLLVSVFRSSCLILKDHVIVPSAQWSGQQCPSSNEIRPSRRRRD
jgi:hypothetical protein